jgi:LmbE family N-acetylglucosaminyl deacetylase
VRARRAELEAALALAGVPPRRAREAGAVDQEASLGLTALARRAADLVAEVAPDLVLAPAYEGGHPDHDAAAFVAAAACALAAPPGCVRAEFPLYHAAADGSGPHEFLPWPGTPEVVLELDAGERALKSRLLACFTTQRGVVSTFPLDRERFRRAPPHDFTRPPHAGPLHYEGYPWGMTARRWGSLAAEALAALGLRT